MEGEIIGRCGDEVSIMTVVYPRGQVSVSSLGYFSSIGYSYKPSGPCHSLSILARHNQAYFKKKRRRKRKLTKPQD